MKKNHLLFLGFVSAALVGISGCGDFYMPESVSIKTAAEYQVPLGDADLTSFVTQAFSKDTILSTMKSSLGESAGVYEYVSAKKEDILSYIVRYPLYKVDMDVGSMLSGLNLSSLGGMTGGGALIDQTISLPEIKFTQDLEVPVSDILSSMMAAANASMESISYTIEHVPELGFSTMQEASLGENVITVSMTNADSITYSHGTKLKLILTRKDSVPFGPDYEVEINASIPEVTGAESGFTSIKDGGIIEIPLDTGKIPSEFHINLSGQTKGGTLGKKHEYELTCALSDGASIDVVEGIKTDGMTPPEVTVSADPVPVSAIAALISSATIGEGEILISIEKPNENWENVKFNLESFSLTGAGFNKDQDDFEDISSSNLMDKRLELKDCVIDPTDGDINIDGKVKVDLAGANIDFRGVDKVKAEVKFEIAKLSEATVSLESLGMSADGLNMSTELPPELLQYVKGINFGELYAADADGIADDWGKKKNATEWEACEGFGLKLNVVNTLPAGSDFSFALKSDFFKLTGGNKLTFNIPSDTAVETMVKETAHPDIDFSALTPVDGKYMADLSVEFPSEITLRNLEMNKDYTLKISGVEPILDFNYVKVDMSSQTLDGDMDLSSFDLGGMMESFLGENASKIKLGSVPVYFFASKPASALDSLLGEISFKGKMKISYNGEDDYLLGEESQDGDLSLNKPAIEWPDSTVSEIDTRAEEYADFTEEKLTDASTIAFDKLADIINARPSAMSVDYSLKMEGSGGSDIKIYNYALSDVEEGDSLAIQLEMAAILPLELIIDGALEYDILKPEVDEGGNVVEKDLLGRSSKSDWESFASYTDSVKYIKIKYNLTNKLLNGLNATVVVDDENNSGLKKELSLASGKRELGLKGSEIKNVLTNFFNPKVSIVIGEEGKQSEISISRTGFASESKALDASISVAIKVDEDSPINLWKAE